MTTYRALDIANYVVHYALNTGQTIKHLQLQKILYFLDANHLVRFGRPLFNEDIEKWKLGPVVPEVYHEYKIFGSRSIDLVPKETILNFDNDGMFFKINEFSPEVIEESIKEFIEPIVDNLLQYDSFELVEITHQHHIWKKDEDKINAGETGLKYEKDELKRFFEGHPQYLEIL